MKNIPIKNAKKIIICPGCGWTGGVHDLSSRGECPKCEYESGDRPYRLCTIKEMMVYRKGIYMDVNMAAFLGALFRVMDEPEKE